MALGSHAMAFSAGALNPPAPAPAPAPVASSATFDRLHTSGSRTPSRASSATELSGASHSSNRPLSAAERVTVERLSQNRPPRAQSASSLHFRHSPRSELHRSASLQSLSVKRSAPSFGFGTASREQANKLLTVYQSDGIDAHTIKQAHTLTTWHGVHSPGPHTAMNTRTPVGGRQPDGSHKDAPVWGMGGADRFLYGYGKPMRKPGPERYKLHPCVGPVRHPEKANVPAWRMGKSTREQHRKVFITKDITMTLLAGTLSPGPARYHDRTGGHRVATGGKQHDSSHPDPPTWKIGKRVWPPTGGAGETPGAKYDIKPAVGGKQPDGSKLDAPLWTLHIDARPSIEPGRDSPGAIYKQKLSGLGKQTSSRKPAAPIGVFSTFSRWSTFEKELKTNTVPGPGHYG